ncbi:hypothetical protein TRIP_E280078 [uncultured Spirochaetota bacterium]|nr:hypothetical protein TRIP_E280078 [uncultured Spirochaetota bacterium]
MVSYLSIFRFLVKCPSAGIRIGYTSVAFHGTIVDGAFTHPGVSSCSYHSSTAFSIGS